MQLRSVGYVQPKKINACINLLCMSVNAVYRLLKNVNLCMCELIMSVFIAFGLLYKYTLKINFDYVNVIYVLTACILQQVRESTNIVYYGT